MDGVESDGATSGLTTMTEGTTVLASNGQAGKKDKKMQKAKSPRRFGRRAKSADRETRPDTPTTSNAAMLESDIAVVALPSRNNSQKRNISRLFRRSSPSMKRSRSLSGTRSHKRRSKSSERCKTDSVVVVGSDVEVSYRTFDPHRKPRGRLRKMTVHEAREEQKQRLLDSVNQLPIFADKTDGEFDSANFGAFRSRSGTSSSMPDIRKCHQTGIEETVEGKGDKTPSEKSPKVKSSSVILSKESCTSQNIGELTPSVNKTVNTTGKGGGRSVPTSPEPKAYKGNNNHSDNKTVRTDKTRQKSETEKNNNKNKNNKTRRFGLNNRKTKQKTSIHQRDSDVQKFQDEGEKVDWNVTSEDVSERRRQSRATFLALSKTPSIDSTSSDIRDGIDVSSTAGRVCANVPPPSKSEAPRARWDDIFRRSTPEKYKSPRSFGRSVSSHEETHGPGDTCEPQAREQSKRSRSESGHRKKGSTKSSESKPNSPSPGKSKSGKYNRTFSPTRKQNEDDMSADNACPVASANKSDTECNETLSAEAESVDSMSNSPVGRINCTVEKSAQSCPNSTTLPHGAPREELLSDSVSPQRNCTETILANADQTKARSNWDKIKCKVVIEATGDRDSVERDPVEESAACGPSAKATLAPFTQASKDAGDRNRLSPEPRSSQSEEEELFYDAKDVLSDAAEKRRSSERYSPVPSISEQQRGSLVTDDIPCIQAAPDSSSTKSGVVEETKKSNKLSIRALVLVKRLSRRSRSLKVKKKPQTQRSSLPDVRIEDYDDQTKRGDSHEKEFVVIENECGKSDNLNPFPFGGTSGPVIDDRGILKKELQFEPVASDEPLPGEDDTPPNLPDLARRRESKYQRLEDRRREIVSCCKQFIAVLFSHIGLISSVVVYAIVGGFLFQSIERPNEIKHQIEIRESRTRIVLNLLDNALLVQTNMLEKSNFTENAEQLLKSFQTEIYVATKEKGWDGKDDSLESVKQWSFASSLLYAITVMTTIGYGHVAPITPLGRLVTIVYAVIGIPLTLLCLTNMGDLMAKGFRFLYARICCGLCCRPFRWRPKPRPDPEKGEIHVMSHKKEDIEEEIRVPTLLCVFMIVGYIFAGAFLFSLWENWDYVTGSYFCFITLSTIGFGDIVPGMDIQSWSKQEKLALCTLYLVVGLAMLAMCFTLVQEDVKAKCRWLGQKIGILERNEK
ncbi:uncharacterized protein LOC135477085 [Liolophura sinensis]|uniref:uncharacterized protein LOC135477085 n=1 Tax=Liolophura sinensis TaxID=3198878 RepID=UPI00315914E5